MSWAFPNRRLVPVAAAALAYLILCTVQRGLLLGIVRHEAGATPADGLRVLMRGTEIDLAVALALALPFVLWSAILPERAWSSSPQKLAFQLAMGATALGVVALATLESFYFMAHRTRLGPGSRPRIEAMLSFLSEARGGAPLVIAGLVALAMAIISVALVAMLMRRGEAAPRSAFGARSRDALLAMGALAFFVALALTREPEFPGRRTLRELSGNGMMPVARAAWRRAPASWQRLLPPAP